MEYNAHSKSKQHLATNNDPALDPAHEHHHAHLHHSARAEEGRHDDVVYSIGTTGEKSTIPDQDPMDHNLHRRHHPEHHPERTSDNDLKDPALTYDVKYDAEKGSLGAVNSSGQERDPQSHKFARFYAKYRIVWHLFIFLLFTG